MRSPEYEERRHRPREVGKPTDDRADYLPAGLAQKRLNDRDQRANDQLHTGPREDHAEPRPRGRDAVAPVVSCPSRARAAHVLSATPQNTPIAISR